MLEHDSALVGNRGGLRIYMQVEVLKRVIKLKNYNQTVLTIVIKIEMLYAHTCTCTSQYHNTVMYMYALHMRMCTLHVCVQVIT